MASLLTLSLAILALTGTALGGKHPKKRHNVVLIMSDDQDRQLGSLNYMPALQRDMIAKGVEFSNHFATVSNCCPSRASLLRGQAAHSTNITHVRPPGGNYDKWRLAGEDLNYLPHWIKEAGYRAEYVGKFLNGYSTANYHIAPKGWDHVDSLLEPYINDYNNVVMSRNGERPVQYRGFHSTDVIRIKALDRLQHLLSEGGPFFLAITPYAPHVAGQKPPTPQARHEDLFPDLKTPRFANWNPPDDIQNGKSVFLKDMERMNSSTIKFADNLFRRRIQSIQGVDEIIEDVVKMLKAKGELDNTFIIFTADNGYHIGAHRLPGGKALPYVQDANLPLVVRGPGMPHNVKSKAASAHLDFAPTFLEIMGLDEDKWPELLDGRSLLKEWQDPVPSVKPPVGSAKEILNIEFWGDKIIEIPGFEGVLLANNSYKSLRIVSEESSWMFVSWCTNEIELYNTKNDPWEIKNLARGAIKPEYRRLLDRLNAILLVTKSCQGNSCRDPWSVLQPPNASSAKPIGSLTTAMNPKYDKFFSSLPKVHFNECMKYQSEDNEKPFYPPGAENGLGKAFRLATDNWVTSTFSAASVAPNAVPAGGAEQRHATLKQLMVDTHMLSDAELGNVIPRE
ncbi:arylsulfatase [Ilyonectria robusta]|uniref:arylsulfatase n=1 Tax=Ilyonectria robusta TaxID=1079257 RepID=UPI001E8CF459|nr:arylsulfatase [Ilyonectria robusta]KAH8666238.1 arylsulfatase [Ilyonectria robusta]